MDAIGRTPGLTAMASDTRAGAAEAKTTLATRAGAFAPSAPKSATAELSPLARDMAASPPVDTARVDQLRDAIIRGDYRPEPLKIAAAMLALEAPARG